MLDHILIPTQSYLQEQQHSSLIRVNVLSRARGKQGEKC